MSVGCDSNIPLVAQELMKKMIHQFALEYASKCLHHTSTNGVTTRTSSPVSEPSDAPLDLTLSRTQEEKESESEPGRKTMEHTVNSKQITNVFQLPKFYPSTVTQTLTILNEFFRWRARPLQQELCLLSNFINILI